MEWKLHIFDVEMDIKKEKVLFWISNIEISNYVFR